MPGLATHLVQEPNIGTVEAIGYDPLSYIYVRFNRGGYKTRGQVQKQVVYVKASAIPRAISNKFGFWNFVFRHFFYHIAANS